MEIWDNGVRMSDQPFDPMLGYQSPQPPPPERRPASVTTLGIIGIIFGALGVLCTPFGLIFYFVKFGPPNPLIDATRADPAWFAYTIGSSVLGWLISLLLLAGSIGAIMLREWGRKCMLAYAWMAVVLTPITYAVNFLWLNAKMKAAMGNQPGASFGLTVGMFGPLLGLILPIFILIYMNKAHVRAAFAQSDANLV